MPSQSKQPAVKPLPASIKSMRSSVEVIKALNQVPDDLRVFHVNYHNALSVRSSLRMLAISSMSSHPGTGGSPHNAGKMSILLNAYRLSDSAKELAAIEAVVSAFESSADFEEAQNVVKPLLAELAASIEAEAEASRASSRKLQAEREKRQTEIDKAIAKVHAKFPDIDAEAAALEPVEAETIWKLEDNPATEEVPYIEPTECVA